MFDRRMLIFVIGLLVAFMVLNYAIPDWGLDFAVFFIGCLGLMVLMHWLGFLEGKDEGFRKGLMENESPFIFLPHGGIE